MSGVKWGWKENHDLISIGKKLQLSLSPVNNRILSSGVIFISVNHKINLAISLVYEKGEIEYNQFLIIGQQFMSVSSSFEISDAS